jgi:hypothetical protein
MVEIEKEGPSVGQFKTPDLPLPAKRVIGDDDKQNNPKGQSCFEEDRHLDTY